MELTRKFRVHTVAAAIYHMVGYGGLPLDAAVEQLQKRNGGEGFEMETDDGSMDNWTRHCNVQLSDDEFIEAVALAAKMLTG